MVHDEIQIRDTDCACETHVRVDSSDWDGKHAIHVGVWPTGERDQVTKREDAREESRLDGTANETVDDRVGLPEPGTRPGEDDTKSAYAASGMY